MIVKPSTILWMVLWVVAAFGLYMVKYKVQAVRAEVASTEKQLREDKKNLHVLMAEWTYLNRPERLAQLSAKYLNVKPVNGQQMGDFSSLAMKSSEVSEADSPPPAHGNRLTLASGVAHVR